MREKVLTTFIAAAMTLTVSASLTEMLSRWVCVKDPCGRCVMSDSDRICGNNNCGGFLRGIGSATVTQNGYVRQTYECRRCGHRVIYENK